MSAVSSHDEYEDALWSNNFYSSASGISLLLLSNHIINLKRTVNIPNLILTNLVSAGLLEPVDAAAVETHTKTGNRTLLMRVSPSMKALESILNDKPQAHEQEVIMEEAEEEDLTTGPAKSPKLLDHWTYPRANNTKVDIRVDHTNDRPNDHTFDSRPVGLTSAWPASENSVYIAPDEQRPHTHSTISVQTFHTARLAETVASDTSRRKLDLGTPKLASEAAQPSSMVSHQYLESNGQNPGHHRNSSSLTTIGGDGDTTPKLRQAELAVQGNVSTKYSPRLQKIATSFPEKEVDSGDTKVGPGSPEWESADTEKDVPDLLREPPALEKSRSSSDQLTLTNGFNAKSNGKVTTTSMLAPVENDPPAPVAKSPAMKSAEIKRDDKPLAEPAMTTFSKPVKLHFPVKSMLDSPKLEAPFQPKSANPAPTTETGSNSLSDTLKLKLKDNSSAFATPRSQISHLSPHNPAHRSPAQIPLQRRSNTMNDLATAAGNTSAVGGGFTNSANSKRFSFRGMFKLKSKNHSLDKLAGVQEEAEPSKPSKPSKITSKSFSTPNFADFTKPEKKKDTRKSFFGKRRKSENELQAFRVPHDGESEHRNGGIEEVTKIEPKAVSTSQEKPSGKIDVKLETKPEIKPEQKAEIVPGTPATIYSSATQLTPVTANLNSKTIREVDDSDYLPAFDQTIDSDHDFERDFDHHDDIDAHAYDPPKRRSDGDFGEELSLEPVSPDLLRMPLDPKRALTIFGSPFAVNYSPASGNLRSPRIMNLNKQASPKQNDALLGDTLFPKLLNPHEVESIVSLERSRSMRSIKSNGKRSSFINYAGSDENIVLGLDLVLVGDSIRRPASILKNSLSMQSIRVEPVQLIDAAMSVPQSDVASGADQNVIHDEASGFASEVHQKDIPPLPQVYNDDNEDLHDFIEFTDFIDVDNLDFSTSPRQFLMDSPVSRLESPIAVFDENDASFLAKLDFGPELPVQDFGSHESETEYPLEVHESEGERALEAPETSQSPAEILLDTSSQEELPLPLSEETAVRNSVPDVIVVNSASSLDLEEPHVSPDTPTSPSSDALNLPILDQAYKLALEEAQARENPSTTARPVSMSFKGFSGSAFKDQPMIKHGSHQLLNLYNDSSNESSAVGQGFGSSDEEDSDEDDYSFEERENSGHNAYPVHEQEPNPVVSPGLKQNGSVANRRSFVPPKLAQKLMGLQPPGPFHHDRIPSLSDHSATSSPRLLTSFISRIKKSPMASPKMAFSSKTSVRFSLRIVLYDTYNGDEYDRHPDIATCNQLTPLLAQQIRDELNAVKSEMPVHRDSQCYTHFF